MAEEQLNEFVLGFFRSESGKIRMDDPEGHDREDQTLNDTLPQGEGLYPVIGLKDDAGNLVEIRIRVQERKPFDWTMEELTEFIKEANK